MIGLRRRGVGKLLHGSDTISFDKGENRLLDVDMKENLENQSYLADRKRAWEQTNQGGSVAEQCHGHGVGEVAATVGDRPG